MALSREVEKLIRKTREGDMHAFRKLYERYVKKVLNFCYHLSGSSSIAEEATQETFISVFKNITSLKDVSRFEPWLYMIARNFVYQTFRKKKPSELSSDETDENHREVIQLESSEGTPEDQFLKGELKEIAMKIIQSLSLKYREVFVLAVLEGYSYQEVAEIVGRKIQSVKTDIHRARLKIREKLSQYLKSGNLENEL